MIDISHQHARRLLRKNLDTHLPEGQWSALQGHLESCAECRAYRHELRQSEKGLRRALRGGWEPIPGPRGVNGAAVAGDFTSRQRRRQKTQVGALALVGLLLFVLLGGPGWLMGLNRPAQEGEAAEVAQGENAPAEILPTAAPTVRPGEFPAVVIYEDHGAGNSEIYLLNPGAEPSNLTEHPANDSAPAWSPDGDWIAFLSDREGDAAGGRAEVYVTDLTGRRVVQLTSQPDVRWEGPISWSPDGKYLALAGVREMQGNLRWLYQVALDGSGARALPGTRGGSAPKYARFGGRLAFTFADSGLAGLAVYHVESGLRSDTRWPENALAPQTLPAVSFDWSRDGSSLAYIAAVPLDEAGLAPGTAAGAGVSLGQAVGAGEMDFSSQIMALRVFRTSSQGFFDGQSPVRVAASRWPSAFRSVSWTPARQVVYLEDLGDARAREDASISPECWRITSIDALGENTNASRRAFGIGGLCVEGGFDMGSWTPDGEWMVVRGRMPTESQSGLFAVRMVGMRAGLSSAGQEPGDTPLIGSLVRLLSDHRAPAQALPRVRPRLMTSEEPLHIDPRPVMRSESVLPPSDLSSRPGGPSGQLVYVVQAAGNSVVAITNPDGTGGRVLYASPSKNECPVWSPDGQQVALVSRSDEGSDGMYVIKATSQGSPRLRLVSDGPRLHPGSAEEALPRFGCPVWSPRSANMPATLAAAVRLGSRSYLAVMPVEGGEAVFARLSGDPIEGAVPAWSPDGSTVYIALRSTVERPSRVVAVRLPSAPDAPVPYSLLVNHLDAKSSWGEIRGLAVRPNAPYLMLVTVEERRGPGPVRLSLRQVSAADGGKLPRSEPAPRVLGLEYPSSDEANHFSMLSDGGYGLVMHGDPRAGQPASIVQYQLINRALTSLAEIEDALYEVSWSPDGRWLVYTTESGLWGLDAAAAATGRAAPVWLSPVVVEDIDWR